MDESAVEKAGAAPLQPGLNRIAGLKSKEDLAEYVAAEHSQGIDSDVLFSFGSSQDFDNSEQVIAFASAGGLGLPDRDYYTKTDAKSEEIRKRYVQHVQRMFQMIGESGPDAQADARTVMAVETDLAKASLTMVEKRDPYNLKHKLTREQLAQLTPEFDWEAYLKNVGAPAFQELNATEPKFFAAMNTLLDRRNLADWRAYLRWHLVHANALYLSASFLGENFEFFGRYLTGATEMPPRWKKCTRLVDRDLGEALGQVFVAKTFAPRTKEEALKMTEEIEGEMGADIQQLN